MAYEIIHGICLDIRLVQIFNKKNHEIIDIFDVLLKNPAGAIS